MPAPKGHAPYNVNGEGGRPPTYTPEYLEKQADDLLEWLKDPTHIFFQDFLLDQNLHPELFPWWAAKSEMFRLAYKIAKSRQESRLKNGAITKYFSEGFAKFLLINNHGVGKYSDKTEQKVISDTTNQINFALSQSSNTSKDLINDSLSEQLDDSV